MKMVRGFDTIINSVFQENTLIRNILSSEDSVETLSKQLKNKDSLIYRVSTQKVIRMLSDYLLGNIKNLVDQMERNARQGNCTESQENKLLKFFKVHREISKNSSYTKICDEQLEKDTYLRVIVWSSQMALSEEILGYLIEFSFDKTMKLYYYYFKYYMSHLNLYYQSQIKIKHLFYDKPNLDFTFSHHSNQFQVHIDDLNLYTSKHALKNSYITTKHISEAYQLGLEEQNPLFHALMIKVKLVKQKNKNINIRTVIQAYWIFCQIDLSWIRARETILELPEMFSLPPDYYQVCQQFLQVFFSEQSEPQTQITIIKLVQNITDLQDKIGIRQFSIGLSDNSVLVLRLLNQISNQLDYSDKQYEQNKEESVLRTAIKQNEAMQKLLKIFYSQINETMAFNNIVQQITMKIYTRKSAIRYNIQVEDICGQILLSLEISDEQIFELSMECITEEPTDSISHLKTLAILLETSYLRQRRDSGAMARKIAESNLFTLILPTIQKQTKQFGWLKTRINKNYHKNLVLGQVVNLITNICSQNPSLITLISQMEIMEDILKYLKRVQSYDSIDSILAVLHFIHNVCLKQGELRELIMKQYLADILSHIFTSKLETIIHTTKQIQTLRQHVHRIITNFNQSIPFIFQGLMIALQEHEEYYSKQRLQISYEKIFRRNQEQIHRDDAFKITETMNKTKLVDRRVSILVKVIEKCMGEFSKKKDDVDFRGMYCSLVEIIVWSQRSFIDQPLDGKNILNTIGDISKQLEKQIVLSKCSVKDIQKGIYQLNFILKHSLQRYTYKHSLRKLGKILNQSNQLTSEEYHQLKSSYCIARISQLLIYFYRQIQLKHFILEENLCTQEINQVFSLLYRFQILMELKHTEVINQTIKNLKNITVDAKAIPSRANSLKVISQQLQGKQLHSQLQDNKQYYHLINQNLIKFIPNLHHNDQKITQRLISRVLAPFITNFSQDLDTLYQNKQLSITRKFEKCRLGMKSIVELFCSSLHLDLSKKKNCQFYSKQMIISYRSLFDMLFQIIPKIWTYLIQQNIDLTTPLPDNVENRGIICIRIMTKMILNRIYVFLCHFEIQMDTTAKDISKPITSDTEKPDLNELIKNTTYIQAFAKAYVQLFQTFSQNLSPFLKLKIEDVPDIISDRVKKLRIQCKAIQLEIQNISHPDKQKLQMVLSQTNIILQKLHKKYLLQKRIFTKYIQEHMLPKINSNPLSQDSQLKDKFASNQKIISFIKEINMEIISISTLLFQDYNLTFQYSRKMLKKQLLIKHEQIDYSQVNIKEQVRKLAVVMNILYAMIYQISKDQDLSNIGLFTCPYAIQLLIFVKDVIGNLENAEGSDKYEIEADMLTYYTLLFIRQFTQYTVKKIDSTQERKKTKKKEIKKMSKFLKLKTNKNRVKNKKNIEKAQEKLSLNIGTNQPKLLTPTKKPIEHQKHTQKKADQIKKKKSIMNLQNTLTQFFKQILTVSEKNAYLKNQTLQGIVYTLNELMVCDQNIHNQKEKKLKKNRVEIQITEIIPLLLKARICEVKHEGFFHLLSQLGVKLIDSNQISVDIQLGIKRYIFENKKTHKPQLMTYGGLKNKISSFPSLKINSLSYFLDIKYQDNTTKEQITQPLNQQFCEQGRRRSVFSVLLNKNSSLNTISFNKNRKRKSTICNDKNQHQENQNIKAVDFVPSKILCILINNVIYNIIRLMVRDIYDAYYKHQKMQQQCTTKQQIKVDAFNITVLFQTLQILIRQSACLGPFITKYKCRKLVLQALAQYNDINNNNIKQFISELLNLSNKKQVTFLALLIRGISPMTYNRDFPLLFEMCLDSVVLQKDKSQKNVAQQKQKQQQQQQYITFGRIVRMRTIVQIDQQLKRTKNILKKAILMSLLTNLLTIKQFVGQCLQNTQFIHRLHKNFIILLEQIKSFKQTIQLSYISKLFIIPFFLSPISLLHELNIALEYEKKKKPQKLLELKMIQTPESIRQQSIDQEAFRSDRKFRQNWPYIGLLDSNIIEQSYESDDIQTDSVSDMFSNQSEMELQEMENYMEQEMQIPHRNMEQEQSSQNYGGQYYSNSWVNNIQSDNDNIQQQQQQDEQQSDSRQIQLNIYPLQQDSIIQQQQDDQQLSQDDSDMQDQMGQQEDLNNSSQQLSDQLSQSQMPSYRSFPLLVDPQHSPMNMYENLDNIITYDRSDDSNSLHKLSKQQDTFFKQLLLFHAGNKDEKYKKYQVFREMFKNFQNNVKDTHDNGENKENNQIQLFIRVSENVQFNNYTRFQTYFWQVPTFEKNLKAQEERIKEKNNIAHRLLGLQRQTFHYIHAPLRRRGILIPHNHHHHEPLLDLERQANLMDSNQIAQQILRRNQQPQQIIDNELDQDIQEAEEDNQIRSGDSDLPPRRVRERMDRLWNNPVQIQLSQTQLQQYLREQNFSIEEFHRLPEQIRDDIVHNILQQHQQHRQYRQHRQHRMIQRQSPNDQIDDQLDRQFGQLEELQINHPIQQQPGRRFQNYMRQNRQPNHHRQQQFEENALHIQHHQHHHHHHHHHNQVNNQQNNQQANGQAQPQSNKRICQEHTKKMNKDLLLQLNKDGKNDHKFIQCSDQFLYAIFDMLLYTLNQCDYIHFPYNLILSLCINSHNQTRIIATLIGLLQIGPLYQNTNNKGNKDSDINKKSLPITIVLNDSKQVNHDYKSQIYPLVSFKILYLLYSLSKEYSIAVSMLNKHSKCIKQLDLVNQQKLKLYTGLEILIDLLEFQQISKESLNVLYLVKVIHNLTACSFNSHIYRLSQKKNQQLDSEREKNLSIALTQNNYSLLCNVLENDALKESKNLLSQIILQLSINQVNFAHFIKYFEDHIKIQSKRTLTELKETYEKYKNEEKNQSYKINFKQKILKNLTIQTKMTQLMGIFSALMDSLRVSVPGEEQKNMIAKLKKILICEEIKQLCETGCDIIVQDPRAPSLVAKVHQFIDFFISIYHMLSIRDPSKVQSYQDNIKIASLGKINQKNYKKSGTKQKFITDYIDLNYLWEKKICTQQGKAFINANIQNKLTSLIKNVRNKSFNESLLDHSIIAAAIETPFMLEFQNKKLLFRAEIKRLKYRKNSRNIYLNIKREDVFQQSFTEIINKRPQQLKGKLKIEFEGEEGQDAGGLTRQWFQLLSRQMFNPNYALFTPSSTGNTYQPYSKSYVNQDHLKYFKFIGRIMGKSLHDNFLLDAYFTPAFYKHILSLPITYEDMQEEDYQFFNSLKWILSNSPIEQYMELYFTYEFDNFGKMETRVLCEGGAQKLVVQQNKIQYIELLSYAKMALSVKKQLESFLEGFCQIVPKRLIGIFDEKQLEVMISGLPTIDINDLKKNTELNNYNKTDNIIIWLFQVLQEFDMGLRTAFLQFVTGTSRVPSQGFKGLQGFHGPKKFNIHKDYQINHLPRAHTCFNQLDLPPYESKLILIEKLTLAITQGKEGFGII